MRKVPIYSNTGIGTLVRRKEDRSNILAVIGTCVLLSAVLTVLVFMWTFFDDNMFLCMAIICGIGVAGLIVALWWYRNTLGGSAFDAKNEEYLFDDGLHMGGFDHRFRDLVCYSRPGVYMKLYFKDYSSLDLPEKGNEAVVDEIARRFPRKDLARDGTRNRGWGKHLEGEWRNVLLVDAPGKDEIVLEEFLKAFEEVLFTSRRFFSHEVFLTRKGSVKVKDRHLWDEYGSYEILDVTYPWCVPAWVEYRDLASVRIERVPEERGHLVSIEFRDGSQGVIAVYKHMGSKDLKFYNSLLSDLMKMNGTGHGE